MKTQSNRSPKGPLVKHVYGRLRAWIDSAQAKKLFVNYESFLKALVEKDVGSIVLKTRNGLSLTIRQNIWDARIIKETFIHKPYVRYFKFHGHPTIVDIGGYIGDFSIYAVKYLNADKVIVYEPTTENFNILKQNIANNAYENKIKAVAKAVSNSKELILNVDIQGSEEVHVSAYLYPAAEPRKIPSVTLSDILAEHQLDSVDLLKVDCEGGEYDIFPNVTDATYSRIRNIVFEYHRVDGFKDKLELVLKRLRSAGYTLRLDGGIAYAYRA